MYIQNKWAETYRPYKTVFRVQTPSKTPGQEREISDKTLSKKELISSYVALRIASLGTIMKRKPLGIVESLL